MQAQIAAAASRTQTEGAPAGTAGSGEGGTDRPEPASSARDAAGYPEKGERMPVVRVEGADYAGVLELPDLQLVLPVLAQLSMPALEITPCVFDGNLADDDLLIAAHNYQTHFGNIKNLAPGARLIFTDAEGRRYEYEMTGSETMDRSENLRMYAGQWDMTLFTCVPDTTSRLAVRFRRVSPDHESRHVEWSERNTPALP